MTPRSSDRDPRETGRPAGPGDGSVLQSILETTSDGILVADLDGEILHYNRQFAEIWGLPDEVLESGSDEAVLQHVLDQLSRPREFLEGVRELYRNPEEVRHDLLEFRDGRLIHRYSRPLVVDGDVEGRVWSFRDVTIRVQTREELRERTEVFEALVSASPLAIDVLDREGNVLVWNDAAERIFGWKAEEVLGGPPPIVPEEYRTEYRSVLDAILMEERRMGYETQRRRKDGSLVDVAVWAAPLHGEEGEVSGALALFADITERKKAERALRASEERYRALFEGSRDAIVIVSREGRVLEANSAAVELAGYDPEDDEIQDWAAEDFYVDLADRERFLEEMEERGYVKDFEVRYRARDGTVVHCLETATEWRDDDGEVRGYLSILRDVTEEKRAQERLEEMAFTDPLTELANRRLLQDRADRALASADRRDEALGLVYLDLRRFKAVNDTLGHAAGDQALRLVTRRLAERIREADTLARLGGDEFGLLLTGLDGPEDALDAAARVAGAFEEPFEIGGQSYRLGASVGVSVYPGDASDFDELVRHADTAMYAASRGDQQGPQLYSEEMESHPVADLALADEVGRALEGDELALHFQPVVEGATGAVKGLEALVRWRHPDRGLLAAREFLPAAREGGWIRAVDRWVLAGVADLLRRKPPGGDAPWLSVNLSAQSISDPGLVDYLGGLLPDGPVEKGSLRVEVTEGAAMRDPEAGARVLRALGELGVGAVLDDFGTGYSSLNHLRWFPVDALKVDISFVQDIGKDPRDEALIRAIVAMGHSLEMEIVAEGVEEEAQRGWLVEAGCDYLQGYLLGRPAPWEGPEGG